MRKALCVGVDAYKHINDLYGCVNDANSVKTALERNGDGTLNFEVKLMCATSERQEIILLYWIAVFAEQLLIR